MSALSPRKHREDTLVLVKSMVDAYPRCAEAWQFGGILLSELNRPATWKKTLEEMRYKEMAYAISPRNCDVAHNYAIALMKSRKLGRAAKVLSNATKICGSWHAAIVKAISKVRELQMSSATGTNRNNDL